MDLTNLILSLEKIHQYEQEEKSKDINYKIKQLPNEMIRNIFSYVSITPFDRDEFFKYHKNKMPIYRFFRPPIGHYNCEDYVIAFEKSHKIDEGFMNIDMYKARTRISESLYFFEFSNHRRIVSRKVRFMDILRSHKWLSKESYRELIAENIEPLLLKKLLPNNKYYSRLNRDELSNLVISYYQKYN